MISHLICSAAFSLFKVFALSDWLYTNDADTGIGTTAPLFVSKEDRKIYNCLVTWQNKWYNARCCEIVTVQDGASSCPAKPNKKHRRFLQCENRQENPFTSELDKNFSASSPAVLNSYHLFYHEAKRLWTPILKIRKNQKRFSQGSSCLLTAEQSCRVSAFL